MARRRRGGTNRDYISQAQQRLSLTRQWRQNKDIDDSWKRFIDLYRHKQYGEDAKDEDLVVVNYIFSTINVMFPSITVNHPKITVAARAPEHDEQAAMVEAVVNYWWKHLRIQRQFRRAAKDYLIMGHGWLKSCWKYEEEEVKRDPDDVNAELAPLYEERDAAAKDPSMAAHLPSDEDIQKQVSIWELQVNEDAPSVERVSPFDMFVDPCASDISEIRWIAQRMWRTVDEIQAVDRYDSRTRSKVKASGRGPETAAIPADDAFRYDQNADYVCVWEYYDVTQNIMCTFPEGSKDYLVKPRKIPYASGHPFEMIVNYEVPEHIYPMGDVEALESLQHELNLTRTQMINHRKRNNRLWLGKKDKIDNDARAVLESDEDNRVVMVDPGTDDLTDILVPVPVNAVSSDFYNQSEVIERDLNLVSGVSEYQRGGVPETRRTATEASILADNANARAADKLSAIEGAIAAVAARLIMLAQMYLTTEQMARVTGADGEPLYFKFGPDEIAGEYDFDVEGGSTQPNNESFRRQSALQLSDAMAPFLAAGVVNPMEMARYLLEKGFGINNAARFLQEPPPPPMPGGPEGAPPGALPPPEGAPMEGPPPEGGAPEEGGGGPTPDELMQLMDGIPPEILAQLLGQVGVQLPTMGGPRNE